MRIERTYPPSTSYSYGVSIYVGLKRYTQDAACLEGNGEKRIKIGATSLVSTISMVDAEISLAEPNESYKLELSKVWKPRCSGSSLSFSKRKSSKSFVFYGNKTNSR